MTPGPIIAIGGGGFTQRSDPALDDAVLDLVQPRPRRVLYCGAASDDDPARIDAFRDIIAQRVEASEVLLRRHDVGAAGAMLSDATLLYVGGGDTGRLLAHWRETGISALLREAWLGGLALAGVSAGAVCWFDCALVRWPNGALTRIDGLGLVSGSCCAHFSSEPERRSAFADAIAGELLPPGLAIDDGAAVLIAPGMPPRALAARQEAWAYAAGAGSLAPLAAVNG